MLSLGSNISATQAVESKYSASFDGTDDFVDFGNINNLGTGDFSFSFWVKASDVTSNYFISKYEDSNNRWYIRTQGSNKVQLYAKKSGVAILDLTCTTALPANQWNHVVVTCDRSDGSAGLKHYLNGSFVNSTAASATDIDNTGLFYIGRYNTNYAKDGTFLEEIGIFNVALDADAVTAIYNSGSPINLTFDQGNYDNSSALQAYYRMGNGSFDNKSNGVVHDQDDSGFGAEKITNGDFTAAGTLANESYTLGWARNTVAGGGDGVSISGGELVMTNDGTSNDGRIYATNGVDSFNLLTSGKVYKFNYTISEVSGGTPDIRYFGNGLTSLASDKETVGSHTVYFKASSTIFVLYQNASGVTVKFSNVSVIELNGKPGLTSGGVTFSSDTP